MARRCCWASTAGRRRTKALCAAIRFAPSARAIVTIAGSASGREVVSPYANAEYIQFCPSKLTHEAVSVTPYSIANCPIALFVYELRGQPGKVTVGYRLPVATPSSRMEAVNAKLTALLEDIAKEATK